MSTQNSGRVHRQSSVPHQRSTLPADSFVSPPPTSQGIFRNDSQSKAPLSILKSASRFSDAKPPPISKTVTLSEDELSPRYAQNQTPEVALSDQSYYNMINHYLDGSIPGEKASFDQDSFSVSESSSQQVDLQELLGDSIVSDTSFDESERTVFSMNSPYVSVSTPMHTFPLTPGARYSTPVNDTVSLEGNPPSPQSSLQTMLLEAAEQADFAADSKNMTYDDTTKLSIASLPSKEPTSPQNVTRLSLPSEPSLSPDRSPAPEPHPNQSSSTLISPDKISTSDSLDFSSTKLSEPSLSPLQPYLQNQDPFATFRENATHLALSESRHYLDTITQLTEESNAFREENVKLENKVCWLDEKCLDLQGQLDLMRQEASRWKEQAEELQELQLKQETGNEDDVQRRVEEQVAEIQQTHESTLEEARSQIEKLRSDLQETEQKHSREAQEWSQLLQRTEEQSNSIDKNLKQEQNGNNDLRKQLDQMKETLQAEVNELFTRNAMLQAQLQQSEEANSRQQNVIQDKQRELDNALLDVATIRNLLADADQRVLEKDEELANMEAESNILRSQAKRSLQRTKRLFEEKINALELNVSNSVNEWNGRVERLDSNVQFLRSSLDFESNSIEKEDRFHESFESASTLTEATKAFDKVKSPANASAASAALNATFSDGEHQFSIDLEEMEEARLQLSRRGSFIASEQSVSPTREEVNYINDESGSSLAGISHLLSRDSLFSGISKEQVLLKRVELPFDSSMGIPMNPDPGSTEILQALESTKRELRASELERTRLTSQIKQYECDLEARNNELASLRMIRDGQEAALEAQRRDLVEMKVQCSSLEDCLLSITKSSELVVDEKVELLERELSMLKGTCESIEKERDAASNQIEMLELSKAEKEKELRDTVGQLQELKVQLSQLQAAMDKEVKDLEDKAQVATTAHDQAITDAENRFLYVQHELDMSRDEYERVCSQLKEATESIESLRSQISQLGACLEKERDDCKEFKAQHLHNCCLIQSLEKEKLDLESEVELLTGRVDNLEKELETSNEDLAVLRTKVADQDTTISSLRDEKNELQVLADTLQGQKENSDATISALRCDLDRAKSLYEEATSRYETNLNDNAQRDEELCSVRAALEEAEESLTMLKESYVSCNEKLSTYVSVQREQEAELSRAKTMICAAEDLTSTAEHRFIQVQNKLQHVTAERDALLCEKGDLEERLQRAKHSIRLADTKLQDQKATLDQHILKLEGEQCLQIEIYEDKVRALEEQLVASSREFDDTRLELENVRSSADDYERRLKETSRCLEASDTKCHDLETRILDRDAEVQDLMASNDVVSNKCDRLREYIRKLTGKCDEWEVFHEQQADILHKLKKANERNNKKVAKLTRAFHEREAAHTSEKAMWTAEKRKIQDFQAVLEEELNVISREISQRPGESIR